MLTFVTDDSTGNIITSYAVGAFSIEQVSIGIGVLICKDSYCVLLTCYFYHCSYNRPWV